MRKKSSNSSKPKTRKKSSTKKEVNNLKHIQEERDKSFKKFGFIVMSSMIVMCLFFGGMLVKVLQEQVHSKSERRILSYYVNDDLMQGVYQVEYHVYTNAVHTNGYVLIDNILVSNKNKNEYHEFVRNVETQEYIHYIHKGFPFSYEDNVYNTGLEYDFFKNHFRTAEAMIIASQENGSREHVKSKEVKNAAKRMEGRKWGKMK